MHREPAVTRATLLVSFFVMVAPLKFSLILFFGLLNSSFIGGRLALDSEFPNTTSLALPCVLDIIDRAMLLTLTTTHLPATDLGYLLRKNPGRPQSFSLSFGKAHVFYPEATPKRCTVALLVEVDPVALVRNRRGPSGDGGTLEQYVNDRPYAASSFLSVAIAEVFGSALSGKSKERPELADVPLPLSVTFSALPCRGGEEFLRKLFERLGYTVSARRLPLDENFPDWGGKLILPG